MAASGKSCSSVAAVLLLVAVLAGTCAPGAHATADDKAPTVSNKCQNDLVVTISFVFSIIPPLSVNVAANTNVTIPIPILPAALISSVQFTLNGKVYTVPNGNILAVTGQFGILTGIAVACNVHPCGVGFISVTITAIVPPGAVASATFCIAL